MNPAQEAAQAAVFYSSSPPEAEREARDVAYFSLVPGTISCDIISKTIGSDFTTPRPRIPPMKMNRRLKLLVNSPVWHGLLAWVCLPPILRVLAAERPATVLEVGCGWGDTARLLLKTFPGATVTAIDYDAAQIDAAQRRGRDPRVRFRQADATALPFPDASFDLAVEFNTLHHIADWRRAVAEIARVLKPGARLGLMDEAGSFWNPFCRWFDRPEAIFGKAELLAAAQGAGLRPLADLGTDRIVKLIFIKTV